MSAQGGVPHDHDDEDAVMTLFASSSSPLPSPPPVNHKKYKKVLAPNVDLEVDILVGVGRRLTEGPGQKAMRCLIEEALPAWHATQDLYNNNNNQSTTRTVKTLPTNIPTCPTFSFFPRNISIGCDGNFQRGSSQQLLPWATFHPNNITTTGIVPPSPTPLLVAHRQTTLAQNQQVMRQRARQGIVEHIYDTLTRIQGRRFVKPWEKREHQVMVRTAAHRNNDGADDNVHDPDSPSMMMMSVSVQQYYLVPRREALAKIFKAILYRAKKTSANNINSSVPPSVNVASKAKRSKRSSSHRSSFPPRQHQPLIIPRNLFTSSDDGPAVGSGPQLPLRRPLRHHQQNSTTSVNFLGSSTITASNVNNDSRSNMVTPNSINNTMDSVNYHYINTTTSDPLANVEDDIPQIPLLRPDAARELRWDREESNQEHDHDDDGDNVLSDFDDFVADLESSSLSSASISLEECKPSLMDSHNNNVVDPTRDSSPKRGQKHTRDGSSSLFPDELLVGVLGEPGDLFWVP